MTPDGIFIELLKSGGISGFLIALALFYLAWEVRALKGVVDGVRETIGEKVFPKLDEHSNRIADLEGRYRMWETLSRESGD